jgi:hypothetical protein
VFSAAAEAAATVPPYLPLVGYLARSRLHAALAAGFVDTGDLRIQVADTATF